MDYYQPMRDQMIHNEMYPKEYRKDFFPKGAQNDTIKLAPKPPCAPKFVTKIEGNAVEEGARVFFEGIVNSQPQPIFTWYFDDEEIVKGEPGWEEIEVHHSRKMSTLILKYAREHHMGKYTLVAQNHLGHAISNCDLIVRKKQFPPVFWRRLVDLDLASGSRVVAEVEVGGWPLPEIAWFKDGERLHSCVHTENYNGFFNAYVPERKLEIKQVDQIRYCLVFHRISESDTGVYSCLAVNPLGEAVCESEFVIGPGEGGETELYLPEKWKTGNRLTWKMEDERIKAFANAPDEPALTPEDIEAMTKRVASTPLPRSMEYFASLPDYEPKPLSAYGLHKMPFSPESGLKGVEKKSGQQGGQPSRPSKFIPGDVNHYGYQFDDFGRICPLWLDPNDASGFDPYSLFYRPVAPDYPACGPRPDRPKSPDGPPVWESQATIDALYKMLAEMGMRLDLNTIRSGQLGDADQARRQNADSKHYMQEHADARKQVMKSKHVPKRNESAAAKQWEQRLNADTAGAQANAEDFTKQFMSGMYGGGNEQYEEASAAATTTTTTSSSFVQKQQQILQQQTQQLQQQVVHQVEESPPPPALPPKTKIMFSPSRSVFSPTLEDQEAKKDFVPVKEKAKLIAQQQEEILLREEASKQEGSSSSERKVVTGENLKGGVRILPPSPVTVMKTSSDSPVTVRKSEQHSYVTEDGTEVTESSSMTVTTQMTSMTARTEFPSHIPVLEDKYHVADTLDELVTNEATTQHHHQSSSQQDDDGRIRQTTTYSKTSYISSGGDHQGLSEEAIRQSLAEQQVQGGGGGSFEECLTAGSIDEAEFEALVKEQEETNVGIVTSPEGGSNQQFSYTSQAPPVHPAPPAAPQRQTTKPPPPSTSSFVMVVNAKPTFSTPQPSPSLQRRVRHPSQGPPPPEEERMHYRSPPQSPFQPAFYRTPKADPNRAKNLTFRLPSQRKAKTSSEKWTNSYDGDTEF